MKPAKELAAADRLMLRSLSDAALGAEIESRLVAAEIDGECATDAAIVLSDDRFARALEERDRREAER